MPIEHVRTVAEMSGLEPDVLRPDIFSPSQTTLADAETRQRAALAELAKLAPQLMALMKAAAQ